jgi:uncharacterized protein (TIGR00159 family)
MWKELPQVHWNDVADVTLVAVLIWTAFSWLRRARSRFALVGVLFLSGIYLAARQLELQLTVWILQGFFAVLVIVLVVVFQEDLRRFFEQLAVWGLRRRAETLPIDAVDVLVRAAERQAHHRTGALYVIPGREHLDPHLEGGILLDARLSEPLLLSLFDPHSPGHDGAAVIAGSRVHRFAVHLPLSTDHSQLRGGGTRHAAALGLAERTDALCVVVSEERGTVSVARDGRLRALAAPGSLGAEIRQFLARVAAAGERTAAWRLVARRWREAVAAFVLAAAMWAVLVPGSSVVVVERSAVVTVENLPAALRLVSVDPTEVQVTLSGPWRLMPAEEERLRVRIDAVLAELGRRTFKVSADQVEAPARLAVLGVQPESVRLDLAAVPVAP